MAEQTAHTNDPTTATDADTGTRLRVTVRTGRLYVDADDYSGLLRTRARHYCDRADELAAQAADPTRAVDPLVGDPVPILDEALACRMVAEELEQRADELDAIR